MKINLAKLTFFISFSFLSFNVVSQNVKGYIKNAKGEAMSYTSILVKGTTNGTMANANGEYAIALKCGTPPACSYEIIFQFLGYKSLIKEIKINDKDITLNVVLEEQTVNLGEIRVGGGNEDPANTIMRKAIAKSKIHDLQVTSFTAKAYIRNTILVNKVPFLLRKQVEEFGIKAGVPTIAESLIEISFKQPATRFVKVLAQRSTLENLRTPDNLYLVNFYKTYPQFVSPLSPRAFSLYRFEYLGYFEDRGLIINKIRVIPKAYGEGVWRGEIYIIDDYWNIHSVNLETVNDGVTVKVNQIYAPIQKVWMPVNQRIDINGSILGLDFSVKAQVNPNYLSVQTNPAFVEEIKVIDEKKDNVKIPVFTKKDLDGKKTEDILAKQKEFSLKNLQKLMKENEKQERKKLKEEKKDVMAVRNDSIVVDSMATKRSASYWNEIRTIPLSLEETNGFKFNDSLKIFKESKRDSIQADSLKKRWKKFVYGGEFKLKEDAKETKTFLKYEPFYMPLVGLNYNTVEGVTSNLGLTLFNRLKRFDHTTTRYKISTDLRYSFNRKVFSGKIAGEFTKKASNFRFETGRYISQFDQNNNVPEWINTISTLIFEDNYSKLFEKKYVKLGYTFEQDRRFNFTTNLEFANRSQLDNLPDLKPLINYKNRIYSPNNPEVVELEKSDFPTHNATLWNTSITWKPGLKYRIRNGEKIYFDRNSPNITLLYRKGMNDVDYDFVSLRVKHQFRTGVAGQFDYSIEAGEFLNANKLYLMDMKHINNSFLNAFYGDMFARFRLLDTQMNFSDGTKYDNYYKFSTKSSYLEIHAINEFRRLLITQIPYIRNKGIKEDFFVNYLKSKNFNNYVELGYGIDGISRLLRFEFISSFEDGKYIRKGFRIGVTL